MSLLTSTVSLLGHALPSTRANRLLILIYHRVHPKPDPMFPGEVDATRFDWQMALLRRHCNPLSLSEGVAGLKHGRLPPRAVAITFDDGYSDNATVALPILQKHSLTATFFITTGFLDGGRMWNDTIIEAVRRADGSELDLEVIGLGRLPLGDPVTRGATAKQILKSIKHLAPQERAQMVEFICNAIGKELPSDMMMTSHQVGNLAAAGMEVGAHTITHPILRILSDADAGAEIDGSRRSLERIVGRTVRVFAYPNGRPGDDYAVRDRQIVESLQFDCAVSTVAGAASRSCDHLQLPRFTPWDRTPARWFTRLLIGFGLDPKL